MSHAGFGAKYVISYWEQNDTLNRMTHASKNITFS